MFSSIYFLFYILGSMSQLVEVSVENLKVFLKPGLKISFIINIINKTSNSTLIIDSTLGCVSTI